MKTLKKYEWDAFLIERAFNGSFIWWAGGAHLPWMTFAEPGWVKDAMDSVHFVHERDAQSVVSGWPEWFQKEVKVTGHGFVTQADKIPTADIQQIIQELGNEQLYWTQKITGNPIGGVVIDMTTSSLPAALALNGVNSESK